MGELTPFQRNLKRVLAEQETDKPPELPDTLAGLNDGARQRSDVDIEIDTIINNLDPIECYRHWVGKMEPILSGQAENNKISCPIPGHTDAHPSAWMDIEKKTWFCGGCQQGGDLHDLAAWHHGFDVPGYKHGESFPRLRRQMAEDFGYRVKQTIGGSKYLSGESPENTDPPALLPVAATGNSESDSDVPDFNNLIEFPLPIDLQPLPIDWRSILPVETFLEQWMLATSVDDLPEEYYFWLGLMAIGLAAGEQAILADDPRIKGNLFVCLYGPSGIGKTRSVSRLVRLLSLTFPYDPDDNTSTGTHMVPMPGSAEALIDAFAKPILDPNDPKKIIGYAGVRGLVRFDEMSALIARSNRSGSAIKPTLMEMFDGYNAVDIVSRGAGRARAEHHFASSVASTQPGAIREILLQTDADSGFINRWIFASGPLKQLRSYRAADVDVAALVFPLNDLRQWSSLRQHEIKLEGDALDVWTAFFRSTIEPIRVSSEKPLLTRVDLIMKKLILLFCINEKRDRPDGALIERVISLYPYLERSYALLVGEIGVGPQQDCREKILVAVTALQGKTGNAVTMRQIMQRLGKKFALDLIVRTISAMVQVGDLDEEVRKGMRGPGTIAYRCA